MLGNVHDIDIRLLRIFFTIYECGGFTQAQLKLGTSQANISAKMSKLESRLGARLCERGASGFKLTPEGEFVIESSRRLFSALDEFQDDMSHVGSQLRGRFNLGLVDNTLTNPNANIDRAIARFMAIAPSVSINILIGDPADLEAQVIDGRLHMAIGLFNKTNNLLDYKALYSTAHALFCGDQHELFSIPDDEISNEKLMSVKCLDRGYIDTISDFQLNIELPTESPMSHANMEGITLLVLSGKYIASLPVHYAKPWVDTGKMRILKPDVSRVETDVLVVYKRKKSLPTIISRFLSELEHCHALKT